MNKIYFFILLINIFYVNEIFNKELKIIYPIGMIDNAQPFIYGIGASTVDQKRHPKADHLDITIKKKSTNEVIFTNGTIDVIPRANGNWGIQCNKELEGSYTVTVANHLTQKDTADFTNSTSNYIIPVQPKPAISDLIAPEPFIVSGKTVKGSSVIITIMQGDSLFEEAVAQAPNGEFEHRFEKRIDSTVSYNLNMQSIDPTGHIAVINFTLGPNDLNGDGPSKPLVPDQNTVLDSGSPGFLGITIPFSKINFTFEPEIPAEFITAKTNADKHGHYKIQVSNGAPLVPGRHKLLASITTPSGESFAGTYFITVPTTTAQDNLTKAIINKYGCKK